ncbi:hypothetical protein ES705_31624 [subsurface metagenome]
MTLLIGVSQVHISHFETGGLVPSKKHIKKITEILGIGPETLDEELHQFYQGRKKELENRMEEKEGDAKI